MSDASNPIPSAEVALAQDIVFAWIRSDATGTGLKMMLGREQVDPLIASIAQRLTAAGLTSRAEVVEDESTVERVARAMWAEVEEPTWDEWEAYVTAHPNWRRNDDLPRYKRQARAAIRALAPGVAHPREEGQGDGNVA